MTFGRLVFAAICLTLLAARPAWPQRATPPRQSGGLFGATRSETDGPGKLNFMFDLAEGVDSGLPAEVSAIQQTLRAAGPSTAFAASSEYARNGRRLQLAGTASTAFRYYQRLDRLYGLGHSAGFGATVRLPKQGSLQVGQTAAYSPTYLYQLFPTGEPPALGASVPANQEYQIDDIQSYLYATNIALKFGSQRGTRVTASGTFSRTDFPGQTETRPGLEVHSSGARIDRAVSRNGSFSVEYQYQTSDFELYGLTKEQRLSIGAEYSPALSGTRRATFRFGLTPARLDLPESAVRQIESALRQITGGEAGEVNGRVHRLHSEASVSYPFRRNWSSSVNYRRDVEYLAVLRQPVFSNSAGAAVKGLISRRVDVSAVAGYAKVAAALSLSSQSFDTYTGEIRVRYALKRSFALNAQYLYYFYDLRGYAGLAPDFPRVVEQHGVRIGCTLFIETLGK